MDVHLSIKNQSTISLLRLEFDPHFFFCACNYAYTSVNRFCGNFNNCVNILQDAKGKDADLSVYKGKVLLVVNVASKWFLVFFFLFLFNDFRSVFAFNQ